MNIFILDRDPVKAAQMLCDKHVIKMAVETAQILCNAFEYAPYKKTHTRHPSVLWANRSSENYMWTIKHGMAICEEYTKRYGKVHKSQAVIEWCRDMIHSSEFKEVGLTEFEQVMPIEYKQKDVVDAYQSYYREAKLSILSYTNSTIPYFLRERKGILCRSIEAPLDQQSNRSDKIKLLFRRLEAKSTHRKVFPIYKVRDGIYSNRQQKRRIWFTKCNKCGKTTFTRESSLLANRTCMCSIPRKGSAKNTLLSKE